MHPSQLREYPLFADLSPPELELVSVLGRPVNYDAAQRLFAVGEASEHFYLIERGRVRLTIPASGGGEAKSVTLRDGAFFGEIGLVRECPRTAHAHVEPMTKLLRFDKFDFFELMNTNAKIARKVAVAIRDRLDEYRSDADADRGDAAKPKALHFVNAGDREGASFIAANVAYTLRRMYEEPVLAMDMDFGSHDLWRYLGTMSDFGSYLPILNADPITTEVVREAAAQLGCGVDLIAGYDGEMNDALRPRHAGEAIARGREGYGFVVVEPGNGRSPLEEEAARRCDVAHIVCTPTERSIDAADQTATWLRGLGLEGRVRFILNRVPENPELDPKVIAEVLGENLLGTVHLSRHQNQNVAQASPPVTETAWEAKVGEEFRLLCGSVKSQPVGPLTKIGKLVMWTMGFGG